MRFHGKHVGRWEVLRADPVLGELRLSEMRAARPSELLAAVKAPGEPRWLVSPPPPSNGRAPGLGPDREPSSPHARPRWLRPLGTVRPRCPRARREMLLAGLAQGSARRPWHGLQRLPIARRRRSRWLSWARSKGVDEGSEARVTTSRRQCRSAFGTARFTGAWRRRSAGRLL